MGDRHRRPAPLLGVQQPRALHRRHHLCLTDALLGPALDGERRRLVRALLRHPCRRGGRQPGRPTGARPEPHRLLHRQRAALGARRLGHATGPRQLPGAAAGLARARRGPAVRRRSQRVRVRARHPLFPGDDGRGPALRPGAPHPRGEGRGPGDPTRAARSGPALRGRLQHRRLPAPARVRSDHRPDLAPVPPRDRHLLQFRAVREKADHGRGVLVPGPRERNPRHRPAGLRHLRHPAAAGSRLRRLRRPPLRRRPLGGRGRMVRVRRRTRRRPVRR